VVAQELCDPKTYRLVLKVSPGQGEEDQMLPPTLAQLHWWASQSGYRGKDFPAFIHLELHVG